MNSHLTHQQMLAFLDGELSKGETRKAKQHLHSCWTCRIEVERLEGDIATILDAQNESFSPSMPPPPGPWPSFDVMLAHNLPTRPAALWMRAMTPLNALWSPARMLVLSSVLITLVIFTYSIFRSKPVSAKEVLHRIQIADAKRTVIAKGQVIRERVHIRKSRSSLGPPRSEVVDTWKSQMATYWNHPSGASAAADLEAQYKAHNLPVDLPLSAASVNSWGSMVGGSPTVSRQGSDVGVSFVGAGGNAEGSVERVSLLVQPETWQVKQMTLEFPNESFEVTEDEFSIVPTSAVPTDVLAYLEPTTPPQMAIQHVANPLSGSMASSMHLPAVNLDLAELDVFSTLHRLNADLGEPVTVTRSNREVQVGLWQLQPDRQNELRAALEGKPGVQVELTAPKTVGSARTTASLPATATDGPLKVVVDSDSEDQRLLKFFGSAEKEQEFTRQALAYSTTILSHLYALRNLQEQFPPEKEQSLAPDERAQLTALIADHTASIAEKLNALTNQMLPLNTAFNIARSPSDFAIDPVATSWQRRSLNALGTARAVDHLLRALLTTSQTPATPDSALPQIDQNLSRLSSEIQSIGITAR